MYLIQLFWYLFTMDCDIFNYAWNKRILYIRYFHLKIIIVWKQFKFKTQQNQMHSPKSVATGVEI